MDEKPLSHPDVKRDQLSNEAIRRKAAKQVIDHDEYRERARRAAEDMDSRGSDEETHNTNSADLTTLIFTMERLLDTDEHHPEDIRDAFIKQLSTQFDTDSDLTELY